MKFRLENPDLSYTVVWFKMPKKKGHFTFF